MNGIDFADTIPYENEVLFSPTYDPLFKGIFVCPGDYGLLASLLSSALKLDIKAEGITVDNTELPKDNVLDKGVRLDLRVTLGDGSTINVEMQIDNEYNMAKRSVYNVSRIIAGQVKISEDYEKICPVIAINILDFNYIKGSKNFHNRYRMKNTETGSEMPDAEIFEINFVELSKLPKDLGNDRFVWWLKFLSAKTEEDLKMVIAKEPKIFGVAVNKLRKLSASEEIRERIRKEEKARMDRVSALAKRERIGMEKGIKKGRKEGMKEGKANILQRIVKNMKNDGESVEKIMKFTGLNKEEIEKQ